MKRETIITAVVFLAVGFLAGYITQAQLKPDARQEAASSGGPATQADAATPSGATSGTGQGMPSDLPKGHPPPDLSAQIRVLEDQAAQSPSDPRPRLELANLLYDNHRYESAVEWYQKALELDPKNVNARTDLGTAYFYSGRPEEALREYRASLKIDPQHPQTLFNMIIVNMDGTHDLAAAAEAWERLHKQNPNYPGLNDLKQKLDAARGVAPKRP